MIDMNIDLLWESAFNNQGRKKSLSILADALEECGSFDISSTIRWMEKKNRWPIRYGLVEWTGMIRNGKPFRHYLGKLFDPLLDMRQRMGLGIYLSVSCIYGEKSVSNLKSAVSDLSKILSQFESDYNFSNYHDHF